MEFFYFILFSSGSAGAMADCQVLQLDRHAPQKSRVVRVSMHTNACPGHDACCGLPPWLQGKNE